MDDMFKSESSVFERKMREAFKPVDEQNSLFSAIALVFYHNAKISEIYDVYKLLGMENFVKLIHLLDGRTVYLPTSTELQESILLAFCFYYREVEGLDWDEIHDKIPFQFSSISMAYKLKSLNSAIRSELKEIFRGDFGEKKDRPNAGR
jgi:Mor family transcriptional regulator